MLLGPAGTGIDFTVRPDARSTTAIRRSVSHVTRAKGWRVTPRSPARSATGAAAAVMRKGRRSTAFQDTALGCRKVRCRQRDLGGNLPRIPFGGCVWSEGVVPRIIG